MNSPSLKGLLKEDIFVMCGIAGILGFHGDKSYHLKAMTNALVHRGPDDSGVWVDEASGVGLGHRRLAILDLTPAGHQPMASQSGRYEITFNGEIYNFLELRAELENRGHRFRGRSDTEVMLATFDEWGLVKALSRFVGMFAFALWDGHDRSMHLVRDRLGKKPLYYCWADDVFLFGSELKALRAHPAFKFELDRNAVALYMRYGYVPAPYTIYKDVFKLPPGTILRVVPSIPGNVEGPCQYWSIHEDAAHGEPSCLKSDVGYAIAQLDHLLRDAVKVRMISDVPLGAFLSGGIDSSLVVALMQSQSGSPVRTFTIGFEESDFDEAKHAKAVAKHLGTNHTEFYVTAEESKSVIPLLPDLYDEPFSDSSQIPTYLVSKLARQHVTVALSGDGGDESFFGYKRYRTARYLWGPIHWLPEAMRSSIAGVLSMVSPTVLKDLLPWITPELNKHGRSGTVGDKLQKAASLLKAKNPEHLYQALVSHWEMPENVILSAEEPMLPHHVSFHANDRNSFCSYMMYQDTVRYLPDDILVKVDRANMGVSLECRNPLLDHRVVEYAWTLPLNMKYNDGQGKWILRQLLEKYLPKEYINRPKSGFTVPIASWLRGPLREWAEDLLNKERLNRDGFLNSTLIRRRWEEHLSGTRNWHRQLWDVLIFQCWLDRWRYA